MWDDVIISKKDGYSDKGTGAYTCYQIKGTHRISENHISYWAILSFPMEIGMTIFKDTKEGEMLTHMIEQKETIIEIERYLLSIAVKKISPKILIEKINDLGNKRFEDGRRAKVKELRNVLDIN